MLIESILKNNEYNVSWYKMTNSKEMVNRTAEMNSRIVFKETYLEFWPITTNDSGIYFCTLQNETSRMVILKVQKKNQDYGVASPCMSTQTEKRGTFVKIQFEQYEDYANTDCSVVWYKDYNVYKENGKEITFDEVSNSDAGNYSCVITLVHEGQKYNVTRTRRLIVEEPEDVVKPSIRGIDKVQFVDIELGQNLTFECEAFVGYKNVLNCELYWLVANMSEFNFVEDCPNIIETTCGTDMKSQYLEGDMIVSTELHLINATEENIKNAYMCKLDCPNKSNFSSKQFKLQRKAEKSQDISKRVFITSMVASITCSICTVIVVVLCLLFRIDMVLLYRNLTGKDETTKDGKEYDAYLSFLNHSIIEAKEEREFALHILPTILENQFGYKLCIFERDIMPGGAMVDDMHTFLDKSRRLIMLLSRNYISDKAMYELESGLYKSMVERKIKAILIEYTPLNEFNIMPESLQLLKASNRVKWEGDKSRPLTSRFWKKIQYLMPAKPIKPSTSLSEFGKSMLF
ncbi:hypothetical protein FKM82_008932 [Ascaphus truei]